MMIEITEEEIKEFDECKNWMFMGDDGKMHFYEDTPQRIKDIYEKINKKYSSLPS